MRSKYGWTVADTAIQDIGFLGYSETYEANSKRKPEIWCATNLFFKTSFLLISAKNKYAISLEIIFFFKIQNVKLNIT